jgi:predicted DNA-binding protein
MSEKDTRVTIRLSKEDREAAERLAKQDKRSLSNWLRVLIERATEEARKQEEQDQGNSPPAQVAA